MTFQNFIISKYPLYADIDFLIINVSWGEVLKLYEEYNAKYPNLVTVEMHEPKCLQCGSAINTNYSRDGIYCSFFCRDKALELAVKHTQDNHLKTNG